MSNLEPAAPPPNPLAQPHSAALRALARIVERLTQAATHTERVEALIELVHWMRYRDAAIELDVGTELEASHPKWRRAQVLIALLERSPELRHAVAASLAATLEATHGLALFAEAGLPNDRGIIDETGDRVSRRLLPRPRDEHELSRLLPRAFDHSRDADWIAALPQEWFARLLAALHEGGANAVSLRGAMAESLILLAARIEALGLSEALRSRRAELSVRNSAFHHLMRSTERLVEALATEQDAREMCDAWRRDVEGCRAGLAETRAKLESTGVSIDVVYALDVIARGLERMELIVAALVAEPGAPRARTSQQLLAELVRARLDDSSLRALARRNLGLLARKVVERAGTTGEHYITSTRRGWFAMLTSGLGGGVVTVFTAAFKLAITARHLPLAIEGLASGVNYAVSFVSIQVAGCTLATKQPAMTGAALAGIVEKTHGDERAEQLATLFARIVRSQIAAAAGNILAVISGALVFDLLWRSATGEHYLEPEKADYVFHSLSPWGSGTAFYAALTGVVLWMASLIGGSVENWCIYRRLPQAIAEHRLGRRVGVARMQSLASYFARRVADYSVNISLGFMLGFTPILGKFFGLPIDVRHVTLSSGQLGLALATLGPGFWLDPRAYAGLAGIAVCFVLNLSVSFGLALRTALRARDVRPHDQREIVRAVLHKLAHSPFSFVWPPKGEVGAPNAHE